MVITSYGQEPHLTLSLSAEGALQQVLNWPAEGGRLQVGETADFLHHWSRRSEITALNHPLAPKVRLALDQSQDELTISASDNLSHLPWDKWLGKRINWRSTSAPTQDAKNERSHRHVVSLSYDIANSTELMAHLGAEDYSELLRQLHGTFARIVQTWQGRADLSQGDDGCMCYFGSEQADEHAALSALQAAQQMQRAALTHAWPVRIGLAQGWVAVDEGQPVGLSVHLAARVQKAANVGAVWLTQDLKEHLSENFAFTQVQTEQVLKGFGADVQLNQLLSTSSSALIQSHEGAPPQPFKSLCIGRIAQLEALASAWSAVCSGRAQECWIRGVAGIGKSTLLGQALKDMPNARIVHLRSSPHDDRIVFGTLSAWVANELGVPRHIPKQEQVERLHQILQKQPHWGEYQSALLDLLELPSDSTPFEDPTARHNNTLQAMLQWAQNESCSTRLVIVLDDYQWADASTQQWVNLLQKQLRSGWPALLIVSWRTELYAQPNSEHVAGQLQIPIQGEPDHDIQLEAFNPYESRALIEHVAPQLAGNPHWLGVLQARAKGNPLFLRETARLFASEAQQFQLERARKLGQTLLVPASLQDLLMQRLDQLGAMKRIVQTASIFGHTFSWSDVQALHQSWPGTSANASQGALQTLLSANIWVANLHDTNSDVQSSAVGGSYTFSHGLLCDVAYQSMWEADRRRLHAAAAQLMSERAHIEPQQVTQLARHWAAAGETTLAIDQFLAEGKVSKKRGAHGVAVQCMETALELLCSQALTSETAAKRIDAHLALAGQAIVTQGYAAQALHEHSGQAVEISRAWGTPKALLRSQLNLQSIYFMQGDFSNAHRLLDESMESATLVNHPLTTLQHQWARGNLVFYEGDFIATERIMAGCVQWCSEHNLGDELIQNPKVMAQMYRAYSLWCLGRAGDALEAARLGCQWAEAGNHRLTCVQAHGIAAMVTYGCGLWPETLANADAAYASCAEGEYALWLAHAGVMRGAALAQLGQVQEGIAQMRASHKQWADGGGMLTRSYYWVLESEILKNNHDLAGSKHVIAQAKEMMMKIPERYYASEVRRISACLQWDATQDEDIKNSAYEQLTNAYEDASSRQAWGLAIRVATSLLERSTTADRTEQANEYLVECVRHIQKIDRIPSESQDRVAKTPALIIDIANFRKTAS